MENITSEQIIEALLFSSSEPLKIKEIKKIIGKTQIEIKKSLNRLNKFYQKTGRTFRIEEIAGSYQIRTKPEYAYWIKKNSYIKKIQLTQSSLETLSIIAYRQPISKQQIDGIRTVDTGSVIRKLLERKLIRIYGRDNTIGKPILYATSEKFLEIIGLKKITDLPQLHEIDTINYSH